MEKKKEGENKGEGGSREGRGRWGREEVKEEVREGREGKKEKMECT